MLSTLLLLLIAVYSINTLYNLVANSLSPTLSIILAGSPIFGVLILVFAWLFVMRGKTGVGVGFLTGGIFLLSIIGFISGYITFQLAIWNQVILIVVALPFTSHRTYQQIGLLVTVTVITICGYILLSTNAYSSAAYFSQYMRNIVVGLSVIIMAYIMFRVQGILLEGQNRERAAKVALTEIKQNLERTVEERTQALTEANQKLSRRNNLLTSLHEIRLGILNHLDIYDLMIAVLAEDSALLNTPNTAIHLVSPDESRINKIAGTGVLNNLPGLVAVKGEGLIGLVWQNNHFIAVDDYATWENRAPGVELDAFHACVAAPLVSGDKVTGVMVAVRTDPGRPFTAEEVDLHIRLAQIASVAYDNSRLYDALRMSEQTLEARVEERTRSLQRALEENDALRLRAIDAATTAERSRLARELHDSVSQAVYGISLGARAAETILERGAGDIMQPLSYIISLSQTALAEIRALIFEMKPESLKDEGLMAAFNKHVDVLRHRHAINVVLRLPVNEPATSIEVKYALYRVMQKATHNIIKHALASTITIELREHDNALLMSVCDDGIGFDASQKHPGHHGLENMKERVSALSGTLQLESSLKREAA